MDQAENAHKIRIAWFLFKDYPNPLSRFFCFFIMWAISLFTALHNDITSLATAYLMLSLSLIMEFSSRFSSFPEVVMQKNLSLINWRKGLYLGFLVLLWLLFCMSVTLLIWMLYEDTKPTQQTITVIDWVYFALSFIVFLYLFVNCIMGMYYTQPVSPKEKEKLDKMNRAAIHGGLGDIPEKNNGKNPQAGK